MQSLHRKTTKLILIVQGQQFVETLLTVKEAIVFEATPAEEGMEGVQTLLSLH